MEKQNPTPVRWRRGRLYAAVGLAGLLAGQFGSARGSADGGTATPTQLVFGPQALAALNSSRRHLYNSLAAASSGPVSLVLDRQSGAVMSLTMRVSSPGADAQARALAFLEQYQKLIDNRISASEYVPASEQLCGTSVAVFDRSVGGLAVAGSRLTVHFDDADRIVAVSNGVAPVPSTLVSLDPWSWPGATALSKLMPDKMTAVRVRVLVPAYDGSGLSEAEVVSWPDPGRSGGVTAAVAIGDVALTEKLTAAGEGDAVAPRGAPPRLRMNAGTGLPDYVGYGAIGGLRISSLPAERNPIEAAYRFLEEHPTLLRTGAARCQFQPASVAEDASAPGAFFVKLQQRYGPLPVFGAESIVQLDGLATVMSVSGRTLPDITVPEAPALGAADAVEVQRALLLAEPSSPWTYAVEDSLTRSPQVRLGVFPRFLSREAQATRDRLAWEVTRGHFVTWVDALDGTVLLASTGLRGSNIVRDAGGSSEFGVLFSYTTDEVDGVWTGLTVPRASDNMPSRPGGNTGASLAAVSSFYASLGWSGQDGRGGNFVANTNVGLATTPCPNALYDSLITNQTFICNGEADTDTVGHEHTHGVNHFSNGLIYQDESGALDEAFADLMANLVFPEPGGTWLLFELSGAGAARDMANPGAFGQPANYSGYRQRDATCNVLPWSCDSGFVHTNSGIINKAHQLLADGFTRPGGTVSGIGRDKLARLAFVTMTTRLTSSARFNDVPVAERDVCELFVSRGTRGRTGTEPFIMDDCDAIDSAFFEVGLGAGLGSGWSEPRSGFFGTDPHFGPADFTPGFCPVLNVTAQMSTLSGALAADLHPATATPPAVTWGFGTRGIAFVVPPGTPPPPIGTPIKAHAVSWFNFFGYRPTYATDPIPDTTTCPPLLQSTVSSPDMVSRDDAFGAAGSSLIGPVASTINPSCMLVKTEVELWSNDLTHRLKGPEISPVHTIVHQFLFITIPYSQRATLVSAPPGGSNLQGRVNWRFDTGRGIRVKLRYTFNRPAGGTCTP